MQQGDAMAGKFLTLEEAALQLGVTVDEVHRFVDRKKLFPMRDGATSKFKVDDVERLIEDLRDEVPPTEELVLGDAIDAGDSLFADGGDAAAASNTIVRGGGGGSSLAVGDASGLSLPSASGPSAADIVFGDGAEGNADLALESIIGASSIGASSPSLAAKSGVTGGSGQIDETLAIDLGDAGPADGSGSLAVGSVAGLAGSPEATGAGLALSGALDSGLSLEDGNIEMSGIDLGGDGDATADGGTALGGDDFELGAGGGGDDESASVVIAESESAESSFFGQAMAGEGSSAFGDESAGLPSSIASEAMVMPEDYSPEMGFSGLQLAGLICCSLLLLFGGFIAYDLVRTIGSPESTSLANPLLDAMAGTFGWR
jgi:excisionase family DNA binding protein